MFQQLYSQYNVRPNSSFPALEDNTRLQGSGSDKGVFLLYRYMFPPSLKHPTLAVVGVCPVLSPVFPKLEMQCRWATRVFKVNYSQKCLDQSGVFLGVIRYCRITSRTMFVYERTRCFSFHFSSQILSNSVFRVSLITSKNICFPEGTKCLSNYF